MLVRELYSPEVNTCGPDEDITRCAARMWECDCGIIPVVDREGQVLGVITDRDICLALGTRDNSVATLRTSDVMSRVLRACELDDDVLEALQTMERYKVRRLPVVNDGGALEGILSINDAVLATSEHPELRDDVLRVMKSICAHTRRKVRTSSAVRGGRRQRPL